MFLNISPCKGVMRFGKNGKLSPIYIGPYENLQRVGAVAYRLALPPKLAHVHDVFHISLLKKYIPDPNYVLREESVDLSDNISYE